MTKRARKNPVADTILEQLGGRKFIAMTGAKNLMSDPDALQFQLPRGAKGGINNVSIKLMPDDTYTATFHKIGRNYVITKVAEYKDVHADALRGVFEEATGLYTSLGTMGARQNPNNPRGRAKEGDHAPEAKKNPNLTDGSMSGKSFKHLGVDWTFQPQSPYQKGSDVYSVDIDSGRYGGHGQISIAVDGSWRDASTLLPVEETEPWLTYINRGRTARFLAPLSAVKKNPRGRVKEGDPAPEDCGCNGQISPDYQETETTGAAVNLEGQTIVPDLGPNVSTQCVQWVRLEKDPVEYSECMGAFRKLGKIQSAKDVFNVLKGRMSKEDTEIGVVLMLDVQLNIRGAAEVSRGERDTTLVPIPDILRVALVDGANAITFVHNHPTGDSAPSDADKSVAIELYNACQQVGILLMDMIIIGGRGDEYFSFRDQGLLPQEDGVMPDDAPDVAPRPEYVDPVGFPPEEGAIFGRDAVENPKLPSPGSIQYSDADIAVLLLLPTLSGADHIFAAAAQRGYDGVTKGHSRNLERARRFLEDNTGWLDSDKQEQERSVFYFRRPYNPPPGAYAAENPVGRHRAVAEGGGSGRRRATHNTSSSGVPESRYSVSHPKPSGLPSRLDDSYRIDVHDNHTGETWTQGVFGSLESAVLGRPAIVKAYHTVPANLDYYAK